MFVGFVTVSLETYFQKLIERVESTDVVQNDGKDKDGFYKPTRTLLLRHLELLKDLHDKPLARDRVRDAWKYVVETVPPEWLIMSAEQRAEMKKILG